MPRKLFPKFNVLLIALMLLLGLGGCGSDDTKTASDPAVLVSSEQLARFNSFEEIEQALLKGGAEQLTISHTLGGHDTLANAAEKGATKAQSISELIKLVRAVWNEGFLLYTRTLVVNSYKITYKQSAMPGAPELTGLLMLPWQLIGEPRGILLFTHPTEVERRFSPSRTEPFIDGTMTKLFGYLFATLGYAVVMPDYPGMGDNYETHPYCLTTLGDTSAAMVKAVKSNKKFGLGSLNVSIMGFSEGGYAALASAYYMRNYPADYKVEKVASLSGPYDLATSMKNLMITADTEYPAPYFLPYVINGYHAAYPAISYLDFSTAVVATSAVKDDRAFNVRLLEMLNGNYSGSQISTLIYTVTPASKDNKYYGPISITTLDFQKHLINEPTSELNKALANNTLARGDWYPDPSVKFFFAHYEGDDCVPYGNTLAVQNVWSKYSNVSFNKLTSTAPFTKDDTGSTHAASLVREYVLGMQFLLGITQ